MISETKLDNSFPDGQFLISGYSSPYRLDRNCQGGGIMLHVREDIPSKLLSIENHPIEGFYVEINLRKKKWLLCCSYNPHKNNIANHLDSLSKSLALYSSAYDNYILIGDFNVETKVRKVFVTPLTLLVLLKNQLVIKVLTIHLVLT